MKLLNAGRQAGKTTACLEWLNANRSGTLVTISGAERDRLIAQLVNDYGEDKNYWAYRVISYQSNLIRGKSGPVIVDNADIILRQVYGIDVVGITGTFEDW